MLCNEKYKSSKSPVKVVEWEEIICRVGMRCSEIRKVFRGERENPPRHIKNRPHNRIGRSEKSTLLITVEPK